MLHTSEMAPCIRIPVKFLLVVLFFLFSHAGTLFAQVTFEEIMAGQQCDGRFPVLAPSIQLELDSMVESPFPEDDAAVKQAQAIVSAVAFAQAICNHKDTVSILEKCIEALEDRKFSPACIMGISLGVIFNPDNAPPESPMVFAHFALHMPCFVPPFDSDGRPCQQIFQDAGGVEFSAQAVADFARLAFEEFKNYHAGYFVAAHDTLCAEFNIC